MALYAIGDFHLSLSGDKPMDVFGDIWKDHAEKIKNAFSTLNADDVCVLCGDLSWAIGLEEAKEDFRFIDDLPGRKIILKGNHDYWWSTLSKMNTFFSANGFTSIRILNNNSFLYHDMAVCGTRGWFYEEETGSVHDAKILRREVLRLEASLRAAGEREKLCFLHYPPRYGAEYVCREITELFKRYGVRECYYGHLHGPGQKGAVQGWVEDVRYQLVSADYLGFVPRRIRESTAR
jgi:predicted phosphohydrolase